jgi:hypothetical protein
MAEQLHPAASHHLPSFIVAPGQTDVLMVVAAVVLAAAVFGFGTLFLRLHSLPERVAHRGHKIQLEIVAILCLLALFTHVHLFWVAALLLAFIDIPDFGVVFGRMAGALEKMAGRKHGGGLVDVPVDGGNDVIIAVAPKPEQVAPKPERVAPKPERVAQPKRS